MVSTAPIEWAQRNKFIYFTIVLPDAKDTKIELTEDKLVFSGTSNGKAYQADLDFFASLDPKAEESKYEVKPRNIHFHIVKKEEAWWPRLLKDKVKEKNQVKVDWSRYKDEDEAEGGFDMNQFGSGASGFGDDDMMGGMGGMGGMEGMMGGMGGMGGMMGGMGGMGGMNFGNMMGGMGGGNPDMASLMRQLQQQGGGHDHDDNDHDHDHEDGDSDDEDLPDLEVDKAPTSTE